MSAERTENATKSDEVEVVKKLCQAFDLAANGQECIDVYAALVYCLGRCISLASDPADLLCMTIPKLAQAAKINCQQLDSMDDLEEAIRDDQSQSTH